MRSSPRRMAPPPGASAFGGPCPAAGPQAARQGACEVGTAAGAGRALSPRRGWAWGRRLGPVAPPPPAPSPSPVGTRAEWGWHWSGPDAGAAPPRPHRRAGGPRGEGRACTSTGARPGGPFPGAPQGKGKGAQSGGSPPELARPAGKVMGQKGPMLSASPHLGLAAHPGWGCPS